MACVLAGNAALAQSTLPTEAQMSAWDKKFLPGQYRVEEYDVDPFGKPLPKTTRVKAEAQCLSDKELQAIARGPVMAAFTWQCEPRPERASVDDAAFQMVLACGGSKAKPLAGFAAVSISSDGQVITSSYVKVEIDARNSAKPKQLFGVGGRLTRVADCTASEMQSRQTANERLADAWSRSGKPMAQEVARCLGSIDKENQDIAFATCKAALPMARATSAAEAEVVLLEKLGLLSGYVQRGEQLGFYRQALVAAERFHGSSSPALIDTLVNLALVLKRNAKASSEPAALLGRAVSLGISSADKSDQTRAVAHYRYWVQALADSGDKAAARAAAQRAVDHAAAVLGPQHEDTASARALLAAI